MRSIFQDPTKGPAQREYPAKGTLTGAQKITTMQPPINHRGSSVEHVQNADQRIGGKK